MANKKNGNKKTEIWIIVKGRKIENSMHYQENVTSTFESGNAWEMKNCHSQF